VQYFDDWLTERQNTPASSRATSDRAQANAEQGAKRRRAATVEEPDAAQISADEGSLVAVGNQMSNNGNRALGFYDEGQVLLNAVLQGDGGGAFSAATMFKLHNGSRWSRSVVKEQSRFHMPRTTLCIDITLLLEEWYKLTSRPDTLGMGPRFQVLHCSPALLSESQMLDTTMYAAALGLETPAGESIDIIPLIRKSLQAVDENNGPT